MAKLTLIWLLLYWGGMLASVVNPLYGLLAYLFEYYLRPSLHWWGDGLPVWRYSLIVSLVTMVAFFTRRSSLAPVPSVRNPALPWFMALVCLMVVLTPAAAVDQEASWETTIAFAKLLGLYGLIIGIIRTEAAFNAFVVLHIAGAGWWGWEAYLNPKRQGGRLAQVGSSDTLTDNLAAAHLLTVLPFIVVYLVTTKNRKLQALALIALPFVLNTFILCNSRGATVGFAAAVLTGIVLAGSRVRWRIIAVAVGAVAAVLMLADPEFIQRQQTVRQYDEAGAERIETWRGALNLLSENPFGVGGGGFEYLSPIYIRDVVERHDGERRAAHNTYLLIATEWGVEGLVLFLGFIGATIVVLHRVRRLCATADGVYYKSLAIETGLAGTLVAAMFSNRFSGESIYWLCALAFALYRIKQQALMAPDATAAAAPSPAFAHAPHLRQHEYGV